MLEKLVGGEGSRLHIFFLEGGSQRIVGRVRGPDVNVRVDIGHNKNQVPNRGVPTGHNTASVPKRLHQKQGIIASIGRRRTTNKRMPIVRSCPAGPDA
jgi:hypothetical protein